MKHQMYQIYETVNSQETGKTQNFESAMMAVDCMIRLEQACGGRAVWHMRVIEVDCKEVA